MRLGGDWDSHYESGADYTDPHYRVSFWEGTAEEWVEIHEADVDEVLEWVRANADGRPFTLWARIRVPRRHDRDDVIDVRLHGVDPNGFDEDYPAWAKRGRPPAIHPASARSSALGTAEDPSTS